MLGQETRSSAWARIGLTWMSEEKLDRDARKFYVFMILLGLVGVVISWSTLLDRFLPAIPGLGTSTVGCAQIPIGRWAKYKDALNTAHL